MAEIAIIISFSININIVGIIGKNSSINKIPVKENIEDLGAFDAVLITNINNVSTRIQEIKKIIPHKNIIIPNVLNYNYRKNK